MPPKLRTPEQTVRTLRVVLPVFTVLAVLGTIALIVFIVLAIAALPAEIHASFFLRASPYFIVPFINLPICIVLYLAAPKLDDLPLGAFQSRVENARRISSYSLIASVLLSALVIGTLMVAVIVPFPDVYARCKATSTSDSQVEYHGHVKNMSVSHCRHVQNLRKDFLLGVFFSVWSTCAGATLTAMQVWVGMRSILKQLSGTSPVTATDHSPLLAQPATTPNSTYDPRPAVTKSRGFFFGA